MLLLLVVLVVFPYLLVTSWKHMRFARESAAWPSVPGVVTAARTRKVAWRTLPDITYTYSVEGRDYSSNNVNFSTVAQSRETQRVLSRYPSGTGVTVHYSPQAPANAVLEPGPNRFASGAFRVYLLWFCIIIFGQGFLFWLNAREAAEKAAHPQAPTYDDVAAADPGLGDRLIREGADKGDAKDEGYVGTWYLGGLEGYPKDPAKAAEWFRKSAEQGDAGSQNLLGALYVGGKGVTKDYAQALIWFRKAADQGEPHACVWMGMAYEQGVAGTPKDRGKAIEWYKKAGNDPKAQEFLKRLGAQ